MREKDLRKAICSDKPLTALDAVKIMQWLAESSDTESAHYFGDRVLCKLLKDNGFDEVVGAYERIGKWYA